MVDYFSQVEIELITLSHHPLDECHIIWNEILESLVLLILKRNFERLADPKKKKNALPSYQLVCLSETDDRRTTLGAFVTLIIDF